MLTIELLRDLAPKKTRSLISQDLVDKINHWGDDPKLMGEFQNNVLTYIGVLKTGKYRIDEYMNAVRYVSYKLIGHSDIDAYAITFPDRYQRLIDDGVERTDIAPYVSIYRKTQLVVKVFEQTIIPTNVLNAPMHQESLNELMKIGLNGRSEVARVQALSKVVDITAPDKTAKLQLDIDINHGSVIDDYEAAMNAMVQKQLDMIENGGDLKQITNASIKRPEAIDVEVEDGN